MLEAINVRVRVIIWYTKFFMAQAVQEKKFIGTNVTFLIFT